MIDRARHEETPTITTRRGKQEAVVIGIEEYQRLRRIAEGAEEAWLNRLADEAESEGPEGAVSLEGTAALLRTGRDRPHGVRHALHPARAAGHAQDPAPGRPADPVPAHRVAEGDGPGRHDGVGRQGPAGSRRPVAAQGR
ncbi:type II toxin-antitoxin system prevent-host-death family antitoxin [Streptomyces sp. DH-12]|uniref:type II toxin-antitoxin system prevent-host-death family antitoxin n=1 Tax=Streptomyces sp. DH-12 TaxID=2072509 RepID=UPI00313D5C19